MFHGSIVALVTPMHADGQIDYDSLDRLLAWHLGQGTDAILALGTTGEPPTLSHDERVQVIKQVIKTVNGRKPVIVGTGTYSTQTTIDNTREAMELGAAACLVVTPYYNKPTQEGLYQHYKAVANAVPIPLVLYNVPGRTAVDLQAATIGRLAQFSNIIGVKEASGKVERVEEIQQRTKGKLDLYSGDDATAKDFILAGGKGNISVTANVAPKLVHDMCQAATQGDRATAERIDTMLQPLNKALFLESSPIPVKWALNQMGFIPEGIRLPLTFLSEKMRPKVSEVLHNLKLMESS